MPILYDIFDAYGEFYDPPRDYDLEYEEDMFLQSRGQESVEDSNSKEDEEEDDNYYKSEEYIRSLDFF
ncbi:hypothetical protein [Synechococcus elongatus]|uniref:hypothetical protein n=1 Tax=Synechococcus elongatus TaxID=32046 RepID=UPI000F7E1410|nr:hypothetical protein [Synechococcus elongatus]